MVLASLTFAVAGVRMARRGALAQQLNAIESLAAADVICLDKTGTLTEATLRVTPCRAGRPGGRAPRASGATPPARLPEPTLAAVGRRVAVRGEAADAEVPFCSRRRWSAVGLAGGVRAGRARSGAWTVALLEARPRRRGAGGAGCSPSRRRPSPGRDRPTLPPGELRPLGLVVLAERLRADARATVAFLRGQGVELKVLSGDAPETVAAIAARRRDAGGHAAARRQRRRGGPRGAARRVEPRWSGGSRRRARGPSRRCATRGASRDGRRRRQRRAGPEGARLAIAQGTGTQMAKSVSDLLLVRGDFGAVPGMVAEGRQILRNLQRVAKLYVSKSRLRRVPDPHGSGRRRPPIPSCHGTSASPPASRRHPAFLLALAPELGAVGRGRLPSAAVARFAVPAGAAAGIGVVVELPVRAQRPRPAFVEARTPWRPACSCS